MTPIIFISLLAASNLFLLLKYIRYRHRFKQKGLFSMWPIRRVKLDQLDQIFHTNKFGPTFDTEIYFIGRGNLNVTGGTSDTEAWILSVLAKKSKRIFEFGTCTGKTAYLFAKNSPPDAQVITLTLAPDQLKEYSKNAHDSDKSTEDALHESAFTDFLYTNTPESRKITQLFGDSKHYDEKHLKDKVDLVFVDGSHAYSYILNDSEKAFEMIAPNGLILWHDYRGPQDTKDVFKALNKILKTKNLQHIEGTSLVAYRAPNE
ncbi:MAG: class I SAM-dependent methyltransferase [Cyclobacteriaceae bacterium]|nr:class I SAM-dependent methyltransferase [Cyclobacteriaceae bacterium]